jgi:hypothetical protein
MVAQESGRGAGRTRTVCVRLKDASFCLVLLSHVAVEYLHVVRAKYS